MDSYYQRSKNVPKPTVEKCTRVNFGQTSDEEILSIFQNRGQTAGHYWREGTGFLIDLQHMRDHVESSGRRTPSNRQSRFTPAVQGTLILGQYASSEAQLSGHCITRNSTSGKENAEAKTFFSCIAEQRAPMAYFMPVRLVYFLTDDFGSLFGR